MPKVCEVKDVPVGGVYRQYDPQTKQPHGPELTVLSKGVHNGTGYSLSQITGGSGIRDMHFQYRPPVYWLNDDAAPAGQDNQ